jgi:peptide/nickel transport system substrate-binding protein
VSGKTAQLIFNNLMTLDDRLRVVPDLAERLDNPTPTTYVATLRRGVKFHDGHELTSADVVFTFRCFLDPAFISPRKGAFRMVTAVEARDRYTVVFTLKEAFGSFPVNLVIPIVPDGAGPTFREHPIGTGPYRFVSYAVDDKIELAPFDDYFGGRPKNDGLVLRVVPDDIMRGLELRKGTMDIVVNDLAPDIVYQLDGTATGSSNRQTDYQYVRLNIHDRSWDRRVRQAIVRSIRRHRLSAPRAGWRPALTSRRGRSIRCLPVPRSCPFARCSARRVLDPDGEVRRAISPSRCRTSNSTGCGRR